MSLSESDKVTIFIIVWADIFDLFTNAGMLHYADTICLPV